MLKSSPANGFGSTLKTFRERRRVSQSKLAAAATFDHSYVSRLESGARTPTRDAVIQLASALGLKQVDRDELLASGGFLPENTASLLVDHPEIAEVLTLLEDRDLPPEYADSMRRVLQLLAAQAKEYLTQTSLATTAA